MPRSSLKTALLSPLCLSLVKQRSSAEQWKKNEFMSVQSALAQAQEDLDRGEGLGVHPALENVRRNSETFCFLDRKIPRLL